LIGLQNRERIDPIFGRDIAYRRQWIAFVEHAVENNANDPIAKLSINRLTIVPVIIHPVFHRASYSVIVNYNTSPQASFFFARRSRRQFTIRCGALDASEAALETLTAKHARMQTTKEIHAFRKT